MKFQSLCIFTCILTLLIIQIKPHTTIAHGKGTSGDCGTSGYSILELVKCLGNMNCNNGFSLLQGDWGLTEDHEEEEGRRRIEFLKNLIPSKRARFRVLSQSYQVQISSDILYSFHPSMQGSKFCIRPIRYRLIVRFLWCQKSKVSFRDHFVICLSPFVVAGATCIPGNTRVLILLKSSFQRIKPW